MATVVLGAGVVGTTTAYFLARAGEQVTLVDRQSHVAGEGSFANTGMITPSQSSPWSSPGLLLNVVRGLGRSESQIKIRARALPSLTPWGLRFLRHCTKRSNAENMERNHRLAAYSRDQLRALRQDLRLDYDHTEVGTLKLYWSEESLSAAAASAARLEPLGTSFRVLDTAACIDLEPSLKAHAGNLVGAIHCPDDETGDCAAFSRLLAERCLELGVDFRLATTVTGIDVQRRRVAAVQTEQGRLSADRYVIALGSFSPKHLRRFGVALPIYPVKGYSLTIPLADRQEVLGMPIIDESRAVGITPLAQGLRVGGFIDMTGPDAAVREDEIDRMKRYVVELLPALAGRLDDEAVTAWACLRALTPDGPPLIGPTPLENLYLNTGHGSMGWTMACGSAKVIADMLTDRQPEISLDGLTLARYGGGS